MALARGPMGRPGLGVHRSPRPRRAGESFDFCRSFPYFHLRRQRMSSSLKIDTLKFSKRLTEAGLD
ncbi:MAG: hypothetical protein AAFW98_10910, partial [Pseudomonadota bacterium]